MVVILLLRLGVVVGSRVVVVGACVVVVGACVVVVVGGCVVVVGDKSNCNAQTSFV